MAFFICNAEAQSLLRELQTLTEGIAHGSVAVCIGGEAGKEEAESTHRRLLLHSGVAEGSLEPVEPNPYP